MRINCCVILIENQLRCILRFLHRLLSLDTLNIMYPNWIPWLVLQSNMVLRYFSFSFSLPNISSFVILIVLNTVLNFSKNMLWVFIVIFWFTCFYNIWEFDAESMRWWCMELRLAIFVVVVVVLMVGGACGCIFFWYDDVLLGLFLVVIMTHACRDKINWQES